MNICPSSKESFKRRHSEHIFKNEKSFQSYIEKLDPMKKFVAVKKEIAWEKKEVECASCKTIFVKRHPAIVYCDSCKS